MSIAPTLQWSYLASNAYPGASSGSPIFDPANGVGSWGSPSVPTLTHGAGAWLLVGAAVTGTWSTTIAGDIVQGATEITGIASTTGIAVGHQIVGDGVYLPLGPVATITAVGASTLTFEDLSSPAGNLVTALASGTGVSFTIQSPYPLGALAFDLSPFSGVTLADYDPDGTGGNNTGNGTAVSNLAGQAEGGVTIGLLAAGTYSVSVSYTSRDPQYSSATIGAALSVTVD